MHTELHEHLPEGWAGALYDFGYRTCAEFLSVARVDGGLEAIAGVVGADADAVKRIAESLSSAVDVGLMEVDHPLGCLPEVLDEGAGGEE